MAYFQSWESFSNLMWSLLSGAGVTLEIFFFTLLFSIPLGFLVCFGRMSKFKPLKWFSQGYIVLFRGTPLMLQLLFFYFAVALLQIPGTGTTSGRIFVAIFVFSINYSSYFAEIFRGGIQSVPLGQYEAADMLGFTRKQSFSKIILPQVLKNVLPPVGNEVITLVKDTSLVYIISVSDLLRESQIIVKRDSDLMPFAVAAIFYLLLTSILTFMFNKLEKKFDYYKL